MSAPASAPLPDRADSGFCTPPALAEVIRDLYLGERSGVLVLSRSGAEKRLVLDRGLILSASSSLEDERLPSFLAQRGLLRPEEAEALQSLDDRQAASAVLDRHLVDLPALRQAVRDLTQQILTAAFRWEDMEFHFQEEAVPPGPLEGNVLVSSELIIRALRLTGSFEPIKDAMLRQERAVGLSDHLYLPFDQLGLTPIEGYLVSRIDGRTRVRDILSLVPPAEEDAAARFLFGLLILGLAQFIPPIAPGLLSCTDLVRGDEDKRRWEEREKAEIRDFYALACMSDPTALLGTGADAGMDQVKVAYQALKERYAPSRFLKKVQEELKEELQIIEARLLESFLSLRSQGLEPQRAAGGSSDRLVNLDMQKVRLRKELTKTERQSVEEERVRLAELYFAKARDYWKMGDFFSCIRYCEFACSHNEKDAAIHSLLGQALTRNPEYRWQKRAEASLSRAAELEPFSPAHWVLLGEFYRSHGLHAKAKRHFQKALDILPTHRQALEALEELTSSKG